MLRHARITACLLLLLALLPASCRSPVPIWNDDGDSMTDLRTLRHRGRSSVQLTPGVRLYADEIRFADKRKKSGEAFGRVLLDVGAEVRYEWMMKHGYAGRAHFNKQQRCVSLADRPMLEREFMTQIATEPYTTIEVRWDSGTPEVILHGPTRTDFAKSHPIPPGAVFPAVPVPPEPVRKTLPQRGFSKR